MKKIILAIFIFLFLSINSWSAAPSRVSTYTSGTEILASDVTANEDALFNYTQAGVDTYADDSIVNADINSSANIQSDKLNLTSIAQAVGITSAGSFANVGSTTLTGAFSATGTSNTIGNGGSDVLTLNVPGGMTLSAATTWTLTGALTFSGTIADLGTVTTANIDGGTLDGVQIGGTTATGELLVNDASDDADGLGSQGTSGQYLQSAGAGANPVWTSLTDALRAGYYSPDGTCVLAFDNASGLKDHSTIGAVLAGTSLTDADLVAGKISPMVYQYDDANDFVTVTHQALQTGMSAITLEVWLYRDGGGGNDYFLGSVNNKMMGYVTDTLVTAIVYTTSGNETISQNHGLSNNGVGQWFYVVITWDTTDSNLYINGVSVGNGDGLGNGTVTGTSNWTIGNDQSTNFWGGKIDGLKIYRRKMGAAEVLRRYNMSNF